MTWRQEETYLVRTLVKKGPMAKGTKRESRGIKKRTNHENHVQLFSHKSHPLVACFLN
jgi:hypothetical protein